MMYSGAGVKVNDSLSHSGVTHSLSLTLTLTLSLPAQPGPRLRQSQTESLRGAGLNDGLFFRNDGLFQIIVCIIRCVYRAELILGR